MRACVSARSKEPEEWLDPAGRQHKSTGYGGGGGARKGDFEWEGICQGGRLEKNESPASWPSEGDSSEERSGNVRRQTGVIPSEEARTEG